MRRRAVLAGAGGMLLSAPALAMPGGKLATLFDTLPAWARGSALAWDFVKNKRYFGAIDPTDTHGQTINAPNAAALYTPFAANVLTRTDLGLQTVPTRTNLLTRSQVLNFGGIWGNSECTVALAAGVAPDGTTTANSVVESTNNAQHYIDQSTTKAASAIQYTSSVFVKPLGSARNLKITANDGAGNGVDIVVSLTTLAVISGPSYYAGSPFSAATAVVTAVGSWYWVRVTFTSNAAANVNAIFQLYNGSAIYTGDGASGLYMWNAQLEAAAFASPPILTTTASATVNGNQQVIDLTGRLGTGVAGLIQYNYLGILGSNRLLTISDGSVNNQVFLSTDATNWILNVYNGSFTAQLTITGPSTVGVNTIAFAATTNFAQARMVGQAAVSADTTVTWPSGLSQTAIGGKGFLVDAANSYQYARKLAFSFGPQDQTSFDAMYARAVLA